MIRNQTIAVGVCSLIVISLMIANLSFPKDQRTVSVFDKTKLPIFLTIILVILPMTLIKLYAINCMLEGNCNLFVNILVGVAVVLTVIYVALFVAKIIKQKMSAPSVITQEHK